MTSFWVRSGWGCCGTTRGLTSGGVATASLWQYVPVVPSLSALFVPMWTSMDPPFPRPMISSLCHLLDSRSRWTNYNALILVQWRVCLPNYGVSHINPWVCFVKWQQMAVVRRLFRITSSKIHYNLMVSNLIHVSELFYSNLTLNNLWQFPLTINCLCHTYANNHAMCGTCLWNVALVILNVSYQISASFSEFGLRVGLHAGSVGRSDVGARERSARGLQHIAISPRRPLHGLGQAQWMQHTSIHGSISSLSTETLGGNRSSLLVHQASLHIHVYCMIYLFFC